MTNRSKSRGTAAESAVVAWLRDNGFPYARRQPLMGAKDQGDVLIPGAFSPKDDVVLEVKNCARMELAEWVDEARVEAANAGVSVYAVVHKRRGKANPGSWYVTLPLEVFAEVIE